MVTDTHGIGDGFTEVVAAWLRSADHVPAIAESTALNLIQRLGRVSQNHLEENANGTELCGERQALRSWERRLTAKKGVYRKHQCMFERDPSRLASLVLDGSKGRSCPIPLAKIYSMFEDKWGDTVAFEGLGQFQSIGEADNGQFGTPISANEVLINFKPVKNTATPSQQAGYCQLGS